MYSRHRVAGYSIDHVIKFLFFLLVPVVILDIMISCFVIFSMRSQSIQSLQDTTSLYASQIDTAHISINRYLIRLLTENDDADTLLETQDKLEFISSAERVHNNIDIFLESFEKGYQIFLYNFPFGFILPVILDKMRSGWLIVLAGFGLSVTVEVIQLITKVGCFDVDDMILNTAGAALGYLLFFICDHLRRKIYGKKI